MNKPFVAGFGLGLVIVVALVLIPAAREEVYWRWVSTIDSTTGYEEYLRAWPGGRHASEAQLECDHHHWAGAQAANSVAGVEKYIEQHPQGRHTGEAKKLIESLHWQDATSAKSVKGFERYLQLHPGGQYVAEANRHIESLHWQEALTGRTAAGFERYLLLYPAGEYVAQARENIESLHWRTALRANSIPEFERYLQLHGEGKHAAEAKDTIDALAWREAAAADSIKAYRSYIAAQPQGKHTGEAESRAAALRIDDAPYEAALRIGTKDALEAFVDGYPGHQREAYAREVIQGMEGRDIVDLLAEKKIEIEATGDGINAVFLRVRKLVPYSITMLVPVGSFFVSARPAAQNMVATAETRVTVSRSDWQSVIIAAACANITRATPSSGDTFTIQRSPQQEELARLMPVLDRATIDFATRQAAVWIVTDDASYEDLGRLVTSYFGFGGTRTIGEAESAQAMQICEEAGINITAKRIWSDRQLILNGLTDAGLRGWLESKK